MIACRGNLQCPFGLNLAAYFQQIRATDSDWGGDGLDQMPAAGLIAVLAGGVVVPLVLSVMALDLELRRRARHRRGRDGSSTLQLQKRRKKRHRVRSI